MELPKTLQKMFACNWYQENCIVSSKDIIEDPKKQLKILGFFRLPLGGFYVTSRWLLSMV